jgi:hypothetical protein
MGVATSGSTLFRQIGGSIGVSIFGAVFANRLATNLADVLPPGTEIPAGAGQEIVDRLPPAAVPLYLEAFADALGPVFFVAAGVSLLAFLLTWLLPEVPLRKSAAADGVVESFAMPNEATSLRELERIVTTLARRENRWRVYDRLGQRAGLDLAPAELWLIARLGEGAAVDHADPWLAEAGATLRERALLTDGGLAPSGQTVYAAVLEARKEGLTELLEGWSPEEHDEVMAMLERLARELVVEPPVAA